jgi:ribose transport system ATP-binding protein
MEAVAGARRARAIPLGALVFEMSLADRQLVEIARALVDERCRVLILDEPTSSLGSEEVRVLFERIRAMTARGLCVLYVSHFLEEVKEIADRFTVLRDGRTVGTGEVQDVRVSDLVEMMTGQPASQLFRRSERSPGDTELSCQDVAGVARPTQATFELRRGEVLGIFGLVGSGRTELLRILFGLDPLAAGIVRAFGRGGAASAAARIAQGFGMLSEDRKGEGLVLGMSIADNLTLSKLGWFVRASWQKSVATRWTQRLGVRCRDVEQVARELSGGNQQKIALGRLLHQDAEIFLLDQPTRGIDRAAKVQMHKAIDELAVQGKAVLLVSDDLPELCGLSDRIAVMRRGVLGPARAASAWTEASLLSEAVGASS